VSSFAQTSSHRIDLTFINPYEGQRVVVAFTK